MNVLLKDLWASLARELEVLFDAKRRLWWLWDSAAALAGWALAFVGRFVWERPEAYFVLMGLLCADFATGFWHAWRSGKTETRKAMRFVYKIVAYTGLLFFAFNLGKYEPMLAWLPNAVFFPMALILFTSLVKNLSLLGYVPEKIARWLYDRIDVYKNTGDQENKPTG